MASLTAAMLYRWSDLPKDEPMALLERRRIIGEQAMISQVLLRKGCVVPMHAHPNEQFACVMRGRLHFTFEGGVSAGRPEVTAGPGDVVHLPSNLPHAAEALEETLVLDVFSPPSATTGIDRKG